MKMSCAPMTSAHASASDSITVFLAGTYVAGIECGSGPLFGTSPSPSSADPPERCQIDLELSMRVDAQGLRNISCRQNLVSVTLSVLIVSAYSSNPFTRDRGNGVGVDSTAQQDDRSRPRGHSPPDMFVELQLQADRQTVVENPFGQIFRVQQPVDRRKRTAAHRRSSAWRVTVSRANRIGAILDNELHLIPRAEAIDVRPFDLVRFPLAGHLTSII